MQKKYLLALGGIAVISAVLILALTQVRSVRSGARASTPTPNGLNPVDPSLLPVMPTAIQPEVVDLAPDIPYEDKQPSVVVQHPDGSRTMYLVAPDMVEAFLENLPMGDELRNIIPPPSLMGHEPPTTEP